MTQPLALVLYEKLLPGSQIVNRLQDLGYRVVSVSSPGELAPAAGREKPLLALVDLEPDSGSVSDAIAGLRGQADTSHVPIIAFASASNEAGQEKARKAGATLVTHDNTILTHLPQFLEQALQVD